MEPNVHRELSYITNHRPNQIACSVLPLTSETKPTSIGSFSKNKNYFDLWHSLDYRVLHATESRFIEHNLIKTRGYQSSAMAKSCKYHMEVELK